MIRVDLHHRPPWRDHLRKRCAHILGRVLDQLCEETRCKCYSSKGPVHIPLRVYFCSASDINKPFLCAVPYIVLSL